MEQAWNIRDQNRIVNLFFFIFCSFPLLSSSNMKVSIGHPTIGKVEVETSNYVELVIIGIVGV